MGGLRLNPKARMLVIAMAIVMLVSVVLFLALRYGPDDQITRLGPDYYLVEPQHAKAGKLAREACPRGVASVDSNEDGLYADAYVRCVP